MPFVIKNKGKKINIRENNTRKIPKLDEFTNQSGLFVYSFNIR